jgi:hypothetical protein
MVMQLFILKMPMSCISVICSLTAFSHLLMRKAEAPWKLTITHILLSLGVERARDCDASVLYLNLMTDSLSSKFRNRKDMMLKVNPLK